MQHIDDEEAETEILEYDPHDLNSMAQYINWQRKIIFYLSISAAALTFLLVIAFCARMTGVYCV